MSNFERVKQLLDGDIDIILVGIDENDGGDDNTYGLEGLVDIDGCSEDEDDAMAGMLLLLLSFLLDQYY